MRFFFTPCVSMKKSIFRQYDIRGKVGAELVLSQVGKLGHAIATSFSRADTPVQTVAVGMDGREHSPAIRQALVRALSESGLNVLQLGLCHTPALYFALHTLPVDAGIMVTASHNGPDYNGFKICLGTSAVWGDGIQEIYSLFCDESPQHNTSGIGSIKNHDIVKDYVAWMADHFTLLTGMSIPVVIDCGNGATAAVMPQLVRALQWKNVELLCADPDSVRAQHEANPVVAENMEHVRNALAQGDAQVGIGFDGDGDRMAPMTKDGRLIAGDELLVVFAQQMIKHNPGMAVVFDTKASNSLVELLEQWGASPCMVPTGHPNIKKGVREHNALLAGELSCHFMFKDRHFGYDDGVYAALRLLEMLAKTGKTLDELVAVFPRKYTSPELRLACADEKKEQVVADVCKQLRTRSNVQLLTIDGVRVTTPDGWGIIRVSHTQPALSIRFESDTADGFARLRDDFAQLLQAYIDVRELQALEGGM